MTQTQSPTTKTVRPGDVWGIVASVCLMVVGTIALTVGAALLWSWPAGLVILGVVLFALGFYLAFIL